MRDQRKKKDQRRTRNHKRKEKNYKRRGKNHKRRKRNYRRRKRNYRKKKRNYIRRRKRNHRRKKRNYRQRRVRYRVGSESEGCIIVIRLFDSLLSNFLPFCIMLDLLLLLPNSSGFLFWSLIVIVFVYGFLGNFFFMIITLV